MNASCSLADWLAMLEGRHPQSIELGLDRVRRVADALALAPRFPVVTVGGTNGKGSTCAYLEAILRAAGHRTGLYTSPHLRRYNERVRIAGNEAGDAALIGAFEAVEAARGDVSLTYFEFGTLAAMAQFVSAGVEVAILEVGLGGRLDAVNLWDADAAIVTGVDLDHQDYLGDTREAIGYEKAGIFRAGRPAICADPDPPERLVAHARAIGADLLRLGPDFAIERHDGRWNWRGRDRAWTDLPLPAMRGAYQLRNAAGALAALDALAARLPVDAAAIRTGLAAARATGRFQQIAARPEIIVDVAHNPEAARALAGVLAESPARGRTLAVVGMLADKDAAGVIAALRPVVDAWWTCTPPSARARDAAALADSVRAHAPGAAVQVAGAPAEALAAARSAAGENDRIVAFGSFYTVAAVLDHAAPQS
jgi:dihydrofolate synthase/folylpolyglutamate synthase